MKIYIITQSEDEYGYTLFTDVARTLEKAFEICKNLIEKEYYRDDSYYILNGYTIGFNEKKDQVGLINPEGKFWDTLYFIDEREI